MLGTLSPLHNTFIKLALGGIMHLWLAAIIIGFFGALGGVFNALVLEGGFVKGGEKQVNGKTIWSLGFSTNILTGAFAAFLSWGLYGPSNSVDVSGNIVQLTLSAICGASLIGFSGASWLTTQANKNTWKTTAIKAVQVQPDDKVAAEIAAQSPKAALQTIKNKLVAGLETK